MESIQTCTSYVTSSDVSFAKISACLSLQSFDMFRYSSRSQESTLSLSMAADLALKFSAPHRKRGGDEQVLDMSPSTICIAHSITFRSIMDDVRRRDYRGSRSVVPARKASTSGTGRARGVCLLRARQQSST